MRCFLLLAGMCFIAHALESCKPKTINDCTSKQFLNQVSVDKGLYSADSLTISKQLKLQIQEHKDFFESREYFEQTSIIIDTIVYNKTLTKMTTLIMVKNPTIRQLVPNASHQWYFDGTGYLAIKKGLSISLARYGPSFSNSTDQHLLSNLMRETYFCEVSRADNDSFGKYNVNDIRIWNSAVWNGRF